MSTSVGEFLGKAGEHLDNPDDSSHSICVVIGNEACDLDSAVCATVLAHYLSSKSPSTTHYVPLLNCQHEDISLRQDIIWLLSHLHIDYTQFKHYPEDFKPSDYSSRGLQVILVDHNVPDESLSSHVIEIIDHHEDAEALDCPRTVEMVGSCSTLIAERVLNDEDYVVSNEVATLLLSAIVTDTANLSTEGRTTEKDKQIVSQLQLLTSVSADELYNQILTARYNISDLTIPQLLRADFKQRTVCSFNVGFSTVCSLITKLLAERDGVDRDIASFCDQRDLHLLVLLGIQVKPLQKQIALYQPHHVTQDLVDSVAAMLEANPDLQAERVGEGMFDGIVFEQGKLSVTRKQIVPIVTKCLQQDELEDSFEGVSPPPTTNVALDPDDSILLSADSLVQEVHHTAPKDIKIDVPIIHEGSDTQEDKGTDRNNEDDSLSQPSGSLLQLDSISARLGESMDSFALAQDSDQGGHSPGSSRTSSTYNMATLDKLDEECPPAGPLEPTVNIISPLDSDSPPILHQEAPIQTIPEYTSEEEIQETRDFRTVMIDGQDRRINLKFIEKYRPIVQHGGYVGNEQTAMVVISACYLPSKQLHNYPQLISQLFFYVLSVVDKLVVDDYVLVYLHSGAPRNSMPGIQWFHKFYRMIDRRLRKNVKQVYVVHPTFWVKTMLRLARPFISRKFYRKVRYVPSLKDLSSHVSMDALFIPDAVRSVDQNINPDDYKAMATAASSLN